MIIPQVNRTQEIWTLETRIPGFETLSLRTVDSLFSAELQKLIVGSTLHDSSLTDKVNFVTLLDRAQPMRDRNGRSTRCGSIESVLDYTFAIAVKGGGSFVQKE